MRYKAKGFNLLEVVVGAFIFSVATIAMVTVWGTHYRAMAKSRNKIVANFLAEAVLERALAEGYNGLPNSDTTTQPQVMETTLNGTTVDLTFDVTTDIQRVGNFNVTPPAREDKLKKVTVTVAWTDTTGPSTVVLETIVGSAD